MSDSVIRVDNLGKRYRIGRNMPHQDLREALVRAAAAPLRWLRNRRNGANGNGRADDIIWALRNVSFEVNRGEVLGVIGSNGSGKSTLLKILSRITEPTEGRAEIHGRVGSLLEVGTGFHPELTGRENLYLSGVILGMSKKWIDRHFDEIVDFAGVEKFIDTPVKRYSSGMRVRLGFAVAAHMEPEILIVDEVLAVGDAEFQKKCLGKMQDVAGHGRTVLFVSHNMPSVRNLCSRAIYLQQGRIADVGPVAEVITNYLAQTTTVEPAPEMDLRDWPNRYGSGEARIIHARLLNDDGKVTGTFYRTQPMTVEYTFECCSNSRLCLSAVIFSSEDNAKILHMAHYDTPGFDPGVVKGTRTVRVRIPELPLQCGEYQWNLAVHTDSLSPIDVVRDALPFVVEDDLAASPRPFRSVKEHGFCSLVADWAFKDADVKDNRLRQAAAQSLE